MWKKSHWPHPVYGKEKKRLDEWCWLVFGMLDKISKSLLWNLFCLLSDDLKAFLIRSWIYFNFPTCLLCSTARQCLTISKYYRCQKRMAIQRSWQYSWNQYSQFYKGVYICFLHVVFIIDYCYTFGHSLLLPWIIISGSVDKCQDIVDVTIVALNWNCTCRAHSNQSRVRSFGSDDIIIYISPLECSSVLLYGLLLCRGDCWWTYDEVDYHLSLCVQLFFSP